MLYLVTKRNFLRPRKGGLRYERWYFVPRIIHLDSTCALIFAELICRCYSRDAMIEYMRLCQKYQLHLISDEIYALTTFPTQDIQKPIPFTSLLSIPKDNLIDPSLCHVIHGMSKVVCSTHFY